jgi:hypothetical protein
VSFKGVLATYQTSLLIFSHRIFGGDLDDGSLCIEAVIRGSVRNN